MAIGFYRDKDIPIPHPPIPLAVFLLLEEALRVAWQRLRDGSHSRIDLSDALEDEITHELYEVLFDEVYNERLVEGFDDELFSVVTREAKLRNYDGKKLDKMPDLLVGIKGREGIYRRSQDWIFIECKPVDATHGMATHYGAKGIERFLCGEYAWAMVNALMVGYSNTECKLIPRLSDMLSKHEKNFGVIKEPKACNRSTESSFSLPVHESSHRRRFTYLETGKPAPAIHLRHLWLERN